jgi:hypothetical protein
MDSHSLPIADPIAEPQVIREASRSQAIRPSRKVENKRTRLALKSILLGLAVILAIVWFTAPYVVRDYINRGLSGLPDYAGRVRSVRIHPLPVSLDVYDVRLDKKTGKIPVPFYFSPRWNISLQWSQIFHGVARASVSIFDPQINLVAGPSPEQSQFSISNVWVEAVEQLIPWRVNQIRIHHGEVHYRDFQASPPVDLEMGEIEVAAENMSNSEGLKIPLPSTVTVSARPLRTGTLTMNLAVNFDEPFATFTQSVHVERVPAAGANAILQKSLKAWVKSGEIGFESELVSDKGIYHGYVKPFCDQMEFEPKPSDEGTPGAIWSGLLNTANGLFENDRHSIASQRDISGRLDQPHVDAVSAFAGIQWNACLEALRPGFDPDH